MKNRTRIAACTAVALLVLVRAGAGVEISGGNERDRERLLAISEEWVTAYTHGDLDALMALMHEDAIVMPHNQVTSRGLDEVRAYFASRIGRRGVTFRDDLQEIRISGDWAYVLGAFELEVPSSNKNQPPYVHRGRYFVLYEKVGDDWKMLRDIDNAAPGPE